MPYYCYILECADGTFYTGWTTDPPRRERQHNLGRGARYTATRCPVRMVYIEPVPDHSTALRRERAIKSYSRQQKARLIREQSAEYTLPERPQPPAPAVVPTDPTLKTPARRAKSHATRRRRPPRRKKLTGKKREPRTVSSEQ